MMKSLYDALRRSEAVLHEGLFRGRRVHQQHIRVSALSEFQGPAATHSDDLTVYWGIPC